MKKRLSVIGVVIALSITVSAQRHSRYSGQQYGGAIPQGTQIQSRMSDFLSGANAREG